MLTASLCCFRGLSVAAERKLWRQGCLDWQALCRLPAGWLSERKTRSVQAQVATAHIALAAELPDYFLGRLPGADKIRVLREFHHKTAFVDIETTGLASNDRITAIAFLLNGNLDVFTRNANLDSFLARLPECRLIVTFNGTRFDLPFLRRHFGIDLVLPHLDLMPVLAKLGLKGGLKACEKLAGLERQQADGLDGAAAVELWNRFEQHGDRLALRQLVLYAAEDVIMLEKLAVMAYNLQMAPFPLSLRLQAKTPANWAAKILHQLLLDN